MRISSTGAKKTNSPPTKNLSTNKLKPRREIGLDVWRGFAVLLMMVTHAVAFFHIGDDPVITNIGIFGGLASFTLFLFLSGASMYFSYIKYDGQNHQAQINARRSKILTRTIFIMFGYYVVALVASIPSLSLPPDATTWDTLFKIFTLQITPPFTEFILAFVFFNLIVIAIRPVLSFLAKHPFLMVISGLVLYAAGTFIWGIDLGTPLNSYKALLAGHQELHTFPILQFSIVYFLGILWGGFLFHHNTKEIREKVTRYAIILASLLTSAGVISFTYLGYKVLNPLLRWPPSLTLIAIGLLTSYLVWFVIQASNNGKLFGPLQVLMHYMGTKAFDFFVFHTLILFGYSYLTGEQRHESPVTFVILFVLLVAATLIVTAVFENIVLSLKQSSNSESEFGWILSEKVLSTSLWIIIVVMVGMTAFQTQVNATSYDPAEIAFRKRLLRQEQWPFWWDNSFSAFRQIEIANTGIFPTPKGVWRQINFNHKQAVTNHNSEKDGADLRVVYFSQKDDYFYEVPFILENPNTANTIITFATQADIGNGETDDKYFLYYGNAEVDSFTRPTNAPENPVSEGVAFVGEEYVHLLKGKIDKKWHLKEGESEITIRTMDYAVNLDESLSPDSIVTFNIDGTDIRGQMQNQGNRRFVADVPIGTLDPGIYKVQAVAREPDDKLTLIGSDQKTFYVSYPLYVVWTQDWEGWNTPDSLLAQLNRTANKYDVPMTHFFNPRIYLRSNISKERADALTLFVQNRARQHNDEIGLHLHMWYDLVRASGVTPRSGPAAPWLYGDGGGVLSSAYTKNEYKKILNWSKRMFQDNGLVTPISYRAGGWFTEEHTLLALEETGFLIDSSGRTKPNRNELADIRISYYPPPWNLKATTQPYQPSKVDQNREARPGEEKMEIWEFPNNGADSYWYTASALINRFKVNYPKKGTILYEPQVVNYLSHPHVGFMTGDIAKMSQVFNYTNRFLNRRDQGPVVYSTLENAYYGYIPWAREQTKIN